MGEVTELQLAMLYQAGVLAWPAIALPPETFATRLATHAGQAESLREYLDTVQAADLYLACGCVLGIPAAYKAFDASYLSKVPAFVRKSAARQPQAFLEDVTQILREKLLVAHGETPGKLTEYAGRGSLTGWLRVAAVRTATSLLRNRDEAPKAEFEEGRIADASPLADPELEIIKDRYRVEFQEAFHQAFLKLSAEQRNLLRWHMVDGLNIDKIGVMMKVHRATIARWIAAARESVMEEVKRHLRIKLKLSGSQFDSLSRLVKSQLHVSVARLLKDPGPPQ